MRSLAGWLQRHADFTPDKPALHTDSGDLNYAQFAKRVRNTVSWIAASNLVAGDRVAWLGPNSADVLVMLFACAECELVLLPLNWRLADEELINILDDARAGVLVIDPAFKSRKEKLEAFGGLILDPSDLDSTSIFEQPLGRIVDDEAAVLLVYTSGTTGRPKGAVLSQEALQFNALNAIHMHDMTAHDRIFTVLPLFHVGGLNIQTLPGFYCGAEVRLESQFDPGSWLSVVAEDQPSLTVLVPATMQAVLNHPDWSDCDLSSLRSITTGSTDVPLALIQAFHDRNVPVIQIYGATETGPVAIYQKAEQAFDDVGAIGYAGIHTDVRLLNRNGEDCDVDVAGELLLRGKHVATGYWNRDSEQPEPFSSGWFASGDVARRDKDGRYWFVDRIKRVIISGSENIYPAELERILNGAPGIVEAAVVGQSDERWGEVPVVVAVREADTVSASLVLDFFADHLARFKHPKAVYFVTALPRNAMGKIENQRLCDWVNMKPRPAEP